MSVTIKDIAKIANVSHTTVSRALNDSSLITQETKERIRKIAQELNYTPNYSAKSLVLDKSYNIGLFFSTLNKGTSPHFFYETVRGVNQIIKDKYNLIVRGIDDYQDYHSINRKSFDGIIVMSQSPKDNPFLYDVIKKNIPLVVLNRKLEEAISVNILSDDCKGVYKAVEYLISLGHRDIAIIEGKEGFQSTQERKEGYLQALIDYGIPLRKDLMVKGNYDLESGYAAMQELLTRQVKPSAVFCSNDDMAVGAMKAIHEKRLKVPEDISLVGFDDNVFAAFLSPTLTTVRKPIERISENGAQILLDTIHQGGLHKEPIYIHTELIIRESVKKPYRSMGGGDKIENDGTVPVAKRI
ncbi:MAG: LacI family DNA-binding transcriptional regulator [Bacillota bacterium]